MPRTPKEEAPALLIARTIRNMEINKANLLKSDAFDPSVVVSVEYKGGDKPEIDWAPRLFARIIPNKGLGWIARLREFNPSTRELFLVPRPGRLDESIAQATRQQVATRITSVILGVFLVRRHYIRTFILLQ